MLGHGWQTICMIEERTTLVYLHRCIDVCGAAKRSRPQAGVLGRHLVASLCAILCAGRVGVSATASMVRVMMRVQGTSSPER